MLKRLALLLLIIPVFFSCGKTHNDPMAAYEADSTNTDGPDKDLLTPEILARGQRVRDMAWTEPTYTPDEEAEVLNQYQNLDPKKQIPTKLLRKAILYFHRNQELIPNKSHLLVVDYKLHSRMSRMYLVDLVLGAVNPMRVAHGRGSDRNDNGLAEAFGNEFESGMSSLGFFLTGETYSGKYGYSLRIDGLSATNFNARERAVVVHGSNYVHERSVKQGRSKGCLAVSWDVRKYLVDRIRDGALIYSGNSKLE